MSRGKKILLYTVLGLAALVTAALAFRSNGDEEETLPTVAVERGTIVDKALAVGTIEPRVEVSVKSQFSGVVKHLFAEPGDYVDAGQPLLEIKPNPTPRELVEAERQIELREISLKNLKAEHDRQSDLRDKELISEQEYERTKREYDEAALQLQIAKDQLALLRDGRVSNEKGQFETVVRSPVSGFILEKMVEAGDPVVPLSSYQEGTVLMTMANMNDLVFRGTVDEIDVGRLTEGMLANIQVGALPNAEVDGQLAKIWLKAKKEENSTVFPVELEIVEAVTKDPAHPESEGVPVRLRAGYSANAEIIIEQRTDVLRIPERLITFAGDTARVTVQLEGGAPEERDIETGLSDALYTEVISGLDEGDLVQEKPPKVIE